MHYTTYKFYWVYVPNEASHKYFLSWHKVKKYNCKSCNLLVESQKTAFTKDEGFLCYKCNNWYHQSCNRNLYKHVGRVIKIFGYSKCAYDNEKNKCYHCKKDVYEKFKKELSVLFQELKEINIKHETLEKLKILLGEHYLPDFIIMHKNFLTKQLLECFHRRCYEDTMKAVAIVPILCIQFEVNVNSFLKEVKNQIFALMNSSSYDMDLKKKCCVVVAFTAAISTLYSEEDIISLMKSYARFFSVAWSETLDKDEMINSGSLEVAAINSWTLLLTTLPGHHACGMILGRVQETGPRINVSKKDLCRLLNSEHICIRLAVLDTLVIIWEICKAWDKTVALQVCPVLRKMVLSQINVGKNSTHVDIRNLKYKIQSTIDCLKGKEIGNNSYILYNGNFEFNSQLRILRYNMAEECLGQGYHLHLTNNVNLQKYMDMCFKSRQEEMLATSTFCKKTIPSKKKHQRHTKANKAELEQFYEPLDQYLEDYSD